MSTGAVDADTAIRTYPELAKLAALRDAGWRFQHFPDEHGQLAGIVGWLSVRDYTDALWVFSRTDCRAVRLLAESNTAPGGLVWDHAGDMTSCVNELLSLPDPDHRSAPRLIRARAPTLWIP